MRKELTEVEKLLEKDLEFGNNLKETLEYLLTLTEYQNIDKMLTELTVLTQKALDKNDLLRKIYSKELPNFERNSATDFDDQDLTTLTDRVS